MSETETLEQLAREMCAKDGINPDDTNWMGDPDVPYGTISWPRWQEYLPHARAAITQAEGTET